MNCENCKHWIYGYCRLLDCRREKDFLCNAWELSVSYERTAKMTAELEMSLTDKLLESRQSPETLLTRIVELKEELDIEKRLSNQLYLLLVDDPKDKKLADNLIEAIRGRKGA